MAEKDNYRLVRKKTVRDEVLAKIEQREFEKRAIAVGICPECGNDLVEKDIDEPEGSTIIQEKVCISCKYRAI